MRRILIAILALAAVPVLPGMASEPSSGTVSATASTITYEGAEIGVGAPASAGGANSCLEGMTCDTFELTIDIPADFYNTNARTLVAEISWADEANDLDLFLCSGPVAEDPQCLNNEVTSSEQSASDSEKITVKNPAPGTYRLIAVAYAGASAYKGTVTFAAPTTPRSITASYSSGAFSWDNKAVADESPYAEPSVDVDHSNVIYLTAPGGAGVQMYKSIDYGKTFEHIEIGSEGGGGDAEIEFLSNDIAFTADLRIEDSAVSRSTDRFKTWSQQGVGIEQDRQWLAHRCAELVLLGYHDFIVEAEMVNRSTDGGLTWDPVPVFVSPSGSAPGIDPMYADQGVNTYSGPVVVDQKTGDAYIVFAISTAIGNVTTGVPPFGEPQQIIVGVSHDEGETWELKLVKAASGEGSLAGLIFPWITLDRNGSVYVTWAGRDTPEEPINVFLSYSNDHGETFSTPYRVNTDATGHAHIYTTVSGGDAGVVDMAWYTSSTPDPANTENDWYVDFAQIRNANTASPQISQSRVYPNSIHHGDICLLGLLCLTGGDRSLLDFFQIQVGPDGLANIAFANNGSPDDDLRVWYARQTGGPTAGNALHDSVHCPKAAGGPGPLVRPIQARPQPDPDTLPGTGVGGTPLVAWVLLGAAVTLAGRLRLVRR